MATQTVLIDDMDGGKADETVAFSLDGEGYRLDLSAKNAKKFRDILEPYVEAARASSAEIATIVRERQKEFTSAADGIALRNEIREWAGKNGHYVAPRGRIPQEVVDLFNEFHSKKK